MAAQDRGRPDKTKKPEQDAKVEQEKADETVKLDSTADVQVEKNTQPEKSAEGEKPAAPVDHDEADKTVVDVVLPVTAAAPPDEQLIQITETEKKAEDTPAAQGEVKAGTGASPTFTGTIVESIAAPAVSLHAQVDQAIQVATAAGNHEKAGLFHALAIKLGELAAHIRHIEATLSAEEHAFIAKLKSLF